MPIGYTVDTRLPIAKAKLLRSGIVTALPQNLIEFVKGTIISPVFPAFASKYSWAQVEQKVVACKFNDGKNIANSIGTGMHLLS